MRMEHAGGGFVSYIASILLALLLWADALYARGSAGKRTPRDAAQDAAELCRFANSLNRLNEIACSFRLTDGHFCRRTGAGGEIAGFLLRRSRAVPGDRWRRGQRASLRAG